MKKLILMAVIASFAVSAFGAVGWCGMIWPNSGTDQSVGEAISVYFQIWKDGVTVPVGRGDSIAATLYWKDTCDAVWTEVEMVYLSDVGNNDEYTADIPAPISTGAIHYFCEALDSTDMATTTGTDQNDVALNATTPGILYIVDVTAIDVTVTFQVDMSLETVTGAVTVAGSFNSWSADADTMTDPDMDNIYTVDILFPAGSSPGQEYKFVNGGAWESIGNRTLLIDDSSPTQVLPVVYFNNIDPADFTDIDVTVHFSVDMSAETVTYPYIAGSVYPLVWGWEVDWNDSLILYDDGAHDDGTMGDGIYGALIAFPTGSFRNVEYKYSTDSTDNEPLPAFENHAFVLGDSAHQILPTDTFGVLVNVEDGKLPEKLAINIAPNPFNAEVSISIVLPEKAWLTVDIFDIGGRRAATLHDGLADEGRKTIIWDASGFPSGIYLLRIDAREQTHNRRLLLVK